MPGGWGAGELGGNGETERRAKSADSAPDRGAERGRREMQVVGELIATKPAWKRRRASENDDELLQMLAEGMGNWAAKYQAHGS